MSPAMQARYPGVQFSQFAGAEKLAVKYGLARTRSTSTRWKPRRAAAATREGRFAQEIVPVAARNADGSPAGELHAADEGIRLDASLKGIASVKLLAEAAASRRPPPARSATALPRWW